MNILPCVHVYLTNVLRIFEHNLLQAICCIRRPNHDALASKTTRIRWWEAAHPQTVVGRGGNALRVV